MNAEDAGSIPCARVWTLLPWECPYPGVRLFTVLVLRSSPSRHPGVGHAGPDASGSTSCVWPPWGGPDTVQLSSTALVDVSRPQSEAGQDADPDERHGDRTPHGRAVLHPEGRQAGKPRVLHHREAQAPALNTPAGYVSWETGVEAGVNPFTKEGDEWASIPIIITEAR